MIVTNRILKGLYESIDPHYQPEGTVAKNHNGQFIHYNDGNFKWKSAKGNKIVDITINGTSNKFSSLGVTIMNMDFMNDDLIIIGKGTTNDYLGKIVFTSADLEEGTYYHIINNEDLELNLNNPIRQFFCSYENEQYQRVYWNDGVQPPRSINIVNFDTPIDVSQLNFTPSNELGEILYFNEIDGSLLCGSYSFVFRLLTKDGTPTEFSIPSTPISINLKKSGGNLSDYNQLNNQGGNFDVKSSQGLRLTIDNVDTNFDKIQVVAFRSIATDEFLTGEIISELEINASQMVVEFRANSNLGTITTDEINISTRFILQANHMEFINNLNVLANFKQRPEIPEGTKVKYNKVLGVTLTKETYPILLDSKVAVSPYNQATDSNESKPLAATKYYSAYQYKGIWYRNGVSGSFELGDGNRTRESTDYPYIRIKKYTDNTGTVQYKNISLINEYLNYRSKKVSAYLKGYRGTETYRFGIVFFKKGKPFGVRYIGDIQFPVRTSFWKMATVNPFGTYTDNHITGNVMSLIVNNLDITELVQTDGSGNAIGCDIDGFSIVRCKRDEQVISQGILVPMSSESNRSVYPVPSPTASQDRILRAYNYYSPEVLFRMQNVDIQEEDKLEINNYFEAWSSDNFYGGWKEINSNNFVNKYYQDYAQYAASLPPDGEQRTVEAVYDFPFDMNGGDTAISELGVIVRNEAGGGADGYGTDSKIIVTKESEADQADTFASFNHGAFTVVNHKRPKSNLYGGTSDPALANNVYYGTGHYQEVTTSILNSIKANGKFEFNGIQVFGGDTYIVNFDLLRIIKYRRNTSGDYFSSGLFIPLETSVNTEMRSGVHLNKDRSYHGSYNTSGIGLEGSYYKLEDFNYNDGYSTSITEKFYLPLTYGFKEVEESPFDIIWSNYKVHGEKVDNYKIFPVNNSRTVEGSFGRITAIISSFRKLIYLQERGIGYLPIGERIMTNNNEAQPVQLGIGGTFDRYDTTHKFYGCQHYFSVCKVPDGIVFFDFNNRAFVHLNNNLQLTDQSIIKGLETTFNGLDRRFLKDFDNPFSDKGIYSFYDRKRKEVVMFFKQISQDYFSITYNYQTQTFTGTLDLFPRVTNNRQEFVLSTNSEDNNLYVHERGNLKEFYGTKYDAYLRFIVNNEPSAYKIFDNFRIIGNNKMFNTIYFKGQNFDITENVVDNNNTLLSDYYKYLNFEWRGSYPLGSGGERLRGHYVEVELKADKDNLNDIELLEFITSNRKTE